MCRVDPTPVDEHHDSTSSSTKLPVYFSIKRLRFGFHGICASLSLVVSCAAMVSLLWCTDSTATATNALVVLSVVLNTMTAYQARQLLHQVPLQTEIVPGVVAPHRQAFIRTMSMMHYNNLRIIGYLLNLRGIYYKVFLGMFIYKSFLPRRDFGNGNTWFFVVPMFLGTSLDLCQYTILNSGAGILSIHHHLFIEVMALVIAFLFTVAFRGYSTVFSIYLVSATIVATLFGGGLYTIVSSLGVDNATTRGEL